MCSTDMCPHAYLHAYVPACLFARDGRVRAGLVDDGPHCALVMKYYKGGTVSALIAQPEYMEVPLAYRLKLASQVTDPAYARCPL